MSDGFITPQSALSHALTGTRPFDQAERILHHLNEIGWTIVEIPKPPRIPEPGLWGVVANGELIWYHDRLTGDRQWVCAAPSGRARWTEIQNPTPIRDGIEATS